MKFVTFSFDDGEIYDERLCALFRKYDLRASFGLRSNCCGLNGDLYRQDGTFFRRYEIIRRDDVARVYAGFEICSHGTNHNGFAGKDIEQLKQEIYPDLELFENLTGNKVIGAIYPGGAYDEMSVKNLKKIGIKFCRTLPDGTYNLNVPSEWECWTPTCHFADEKVFEVIRRFADLPSENDWILHIYGHSYELEYKDRDRWAVMEQICDFKNAQFMTLGEIYRYFEAEK